MQEYKLICFDLDGTLIDQKTEIMLPGRRRYFNNLWLKTDKPKIVIVSNQGGVSYRLWLEQTMPEWATNNKIAEYPVASLASSHVLNAAWEVEVEIGEEVEVYYNFTYQFKDGSWGPSPYDIVDLDESLIDGQWRRSWRKPNPGMLLQAMGDADVDAADTLMVGDRPEDEEAAKNAGCAFMWADEFFKAWLPNDNG